jgi:hypothetical protein
MTTRDLRELAWLAIVTGIAEVALCIAGKALQVSQWCHRQGAPQRSRPRFKGRRI